jgi:protein phosphatase
MSISDQDTATFDTQLDDFGSRFFAPDGPPVRVQLGAASHAGKVRPKNEDHYAVVQRVRSRQVLLTNLSLSDLVFDDDVAYSLVVADGIGGASFGEFASRLAIRTWGDLMGRATSWIMKVRDLEAQQVRERVNAYARSMQRAFRDMADLDPRMAHMGTTWTSACLLGRDALFAHVGDSRAYVFRDGKIKQVTRDHTLAQLLVDGGTPEDEAAPYRHILLNCVGGDSPNIKVELHAHTLRDGDRLLLCTDGLTDLAADDDVAAVLSKHSAPQQACDALIELALARGGKDNVTVVLAAIERPPESVERSPAPQKQ